jgi:predicted phosphate transport protein (TIGR00153 family)
MVRLVPSDRTFFVILRELAAHVRSAAALLTELFENPDQHDPLVRIVREDEHEADRLTHSIVLRLGTSFVLPLDSTDIYSLAHALDDIVDQIEDAAIRVKLFEMEAVDPPAQQLAAVVLRAAEVVAAAVEDLGRSRSILGDVGEVWRLEEEADAVYTRATEALFADGKDALEVIKQKEIYDILASAVRQSRDAAGILSAIAIKHG